jgi:A/G-specific adenine glycosylase
LGEAAAVVDGNVERVLTRLHGRELKPDSAWQEAERLLDPHRPGDFNQAMMELGATVCTPKSPQCLLCPVAEWCSTRGEAPVKPQAARKRRQLCYALVRNGESVLLVQRDSELKLMAGMWELPQIERASAPAAPIARFKHSITDTDYEVLVFSVGELELASGRWFSAKQWHRLALTGLARKILRKLGASPE